MDRENRKKLPLHIFLFLLTLVTTTFAGAEWRYMYSLFVTFSEGGESFIGWRGFEWERFATGFAYSLPFLAFLTVHEFGHFFTAKAHKIKVSLPYFIPFWFAGFLPAIGTMGAVIRIRQFIDSRKIHFDIGIAGPLAGFVIALGVLWWGFANLPPQEYIHQIHPEYLERYGADWEEKAYDLELLRQEAIARGVENPQPQVFYLGKSLIYMLLENYAATDPERVPNAYEIIHYPFLFAGFLGLFFTALNLLPIGQLDGGHILYGLVGYSWHRRIATVLFIAFVFWAGLGIPTPEADDTSWDLLLRLGIYAFFLYFIFGRLEMRVAEKAILILGIVLGQLLVGYLVPGAGGYLGWMLFAVLLGRFIGVYHPRAPKEEPLSTGRKVLGWLALLIFVLCFSPEPFVFVGG